MVGCGYCCGGCLRLLSNNIGVVVVIIWHFHSCGSAGCSTKNGADGTDGGEGYGLACLGGLGVSCGFFDTFGKLLLLLLVFILDG